MNKVLFFYIISSIAYIKASSSDDDNLFPSQRITTQNELQLVNLREEIQDLKQQLKDLKTRNDLLCPPCKARFNLIRLGNQSPQNSEPCSDRLCPAYVE